MSDATHMQTQEAQGLKDRIYLTETRIKTKLSTPGLDTAVVAELPSSGQAGTPKQ